MNRTILYYTSNKEDEVFEKKIRENILKQCGDIPIVSVSQKPIDFGQNICVGDVGSSYFNQWRQILIGLKTVKTKYVIFCESDFLYSKDYFDFKPKDNLSRYENVWIVFNYRINGYNRKIYSEGAQVGNTKYLIDQYEKFFEDKPEWSNLRLGKNNYPLFAEPFSWFTGTPCVSFKTGKGVRAFTNTLKHRETTLPYWGDVEKLKEKYLC